MAGLGPATELAFAQRVWGVFQIAGVIGDLYGVKISRKNF
jgi:hypothetical protein